MHIIVCIKQVPDPEGPGDSFEINEALKQVKPIGIPPVLSLFDENALEAALRIKDRPQFAGIFPVNCIQVIRLDRRLFGHSQIPVLYRQKPRFLSSNAPKRPGLDASEGYRRDAA